MKDIKLRVVLLLLGILFVSLFVSMKMTEGFADAGTTSALWGQCGGRNWKGPVQCEGNNSCVYSNDYYSQCLATSAATNPAATTPAATTSAPTTSAPTTSAPITSAPTTIPTMTIPTMTIPATTMPAITIPVATVNQLPPPGYHAATTKGKHTKHRYHVRSNKRQAKAGPNKMLGNPGQQGQSTQQPKTGQVHFGPILGSSYGKTGGRIEGIDLELAKRGLKILNNAISSTVKTQGSVQEGFCNKKQLPYSTFVKM